MDTFTLVTLAVVVLLVALVAWLWRKTTKTDHARPAASDGDEASAPEGALGAVVPESSRSTQAADTEALSTQPPDFADTEASGPDTEQNTLPPELTEDETQDLLHRLQEAAALDAQEAAAREVQQRAKEEAARQAELARTQQEQKEAEENAAKLKALQDQALLAQAQAAAAAALAAQQAEKEKLAAEATREKALLEKLRSERLERERLQREQLEREQEQARQEQAAQAERQAEIERKAREAQALVEAAQAQQRLVAEKLQAEKLEADNRREKEAEEEQARSAAANAPVAAPPAAAPVVVQHGRRAADMVVMVADDSKVVRVKASRLLAKHQYQVLLAEDGADAAAQMQATLPDILITDVEMPGMDGFELTRHLRSNARTAHIPVIMITAADDRHLAAAQEAGVNVLLGKPYEDDDLIARIRSTLRAA